MVHESEDTVRWFIQAGPSHIISIGNWLLKSPTIIMLPNFFNQLLTEMEFMDSNREDQIKDIFFHSFNSQREVHKSYTRVCHRYLWHTCVWACWVCHKYLRHTRVWLVYFPLRMEGMKKINVLLFFVTVNEGWYWLDLNHSLKTTQWIVFICKGVIIIHGMGGPVEKGGT